MNSNLDSAIMNAISVRLAFSLYVQILYHCWLKMRKSSKILKLSSELNIMLRMQDYNNIL